MSLDRKEIFGDIGVIFAMAIIITGVFAFFKYIEFILAAALLYGLYLAPVLLLFGFLSSTKKS